MSVECDCGGKNGNRDPREELCAIAKLGVKLLKWIRCGW